MKPGATLSPVASITRSASDSRSLPIAVMIPSLMPTSARTRGLRCPSNTVPFLIRIENSDIAVDQFLPPETHFGIPRHQHRAR